MIGKHLWRTPGKWKAGQTRTCLKCRVRVSYVAQPRNGARVFRTMKPGATTIYGRMTKCSPPPCNCGYGHSITCSMSSDD